MKNTSPKKLFTLINNIISPVTASSLTALTICAFSFGAHAADQHAGISLGVVGAASIQNPSVTDSNGATSVDGKTSFGGGITSEFVLAPGFGLEVDALYLNHKFSYKSSTFFGVDTSQTITAGYLEVPVLVRYRPIPLINIGLGGYYSRTLSTWQVTADNFSSQNADYGKNDFGVAVALGSMIPVSDTFSIVGDLRYTRSLTSTSRQSNDALKFADFQALVGVRFGIR